jgi:hypothetical protein
MGLFETVVDDISRTSYDRRESCGHIGAPDSHHYQFLRFAHSSMRLAHQSRACVPLREVVISSDKKTFKEIMTHER